MEHPSRYHNTTAGKDFCDLHTFANGKGCTEADKSIERD